MEEDQNARTRPTAELQQRAMLSRPSVVCVLVLKPSSEPHCKEPEWESGSGFVILDGHPHSVVLTCSHVVQDAVAADSIRVRRVREGGGVEEFKATVIASCFETDVAVLRVPGMRGTPALHLDNPGEINEPAIAIGYCNLPDNWLAGAAPARLPSIAPGAIQEYEGFMDQNIQDRGRRLLPEVQGATHELIILNCVIVKGMSGGPVVNAHGVIGFTRAKAKDRPMMIAVSTTTILQRLRVFAGLTANHQFNLQQVANRLARQR